MYSSKSTLHFCLHNTISLLDSHVIPMADSREASYYARLQETAEAIGHSPRITVVGDREWLNLRAIIAVGNTRPDALALGGVIVPGGEFDDEIIRIADMVLDMRSHGIGMPEIWDDQEYIGMHFVSKQAEFSFLHAPYDATMLRSDTSYRKAYCQQLLRYIQSTHPDLIFLSNFKVILDPVVIEAFAEKIVNVHPSVLPLIKGFRPEHRVDTGENPYAAGYTFHLVDTDLDGGPTLFQQRVEIDPYDEEEKARLGDAAYARLREERLRLKIITAQAEYTPYILAFVASPIQRRIVEDGEAFAAEDRAAFENSPEYQDSLQEEYETWKKDTSQEISYDTWHQKHRKPYRRILFDIGTWQTLEAILGADTVSKIQMPHTITRYRVTIHGDNISAFTTFANVITAAQQKRETTGGQLFHTESLYDASGSILRGSFLASVDLSETLTSLGITYEIESMPTRVGTARKSIAWIREEN